MATYTCKLALTASAAETLSSADAPSAASPTIINHSAYDIAESLTASTTVPVTDALYLSKALVAGAGTIDLTALTNTLGDAVDGTTKKLRFCRFTAPTTNTGAITVDAAATNGYAVFGTAGKVVISPGQSVAFFLEGDGVTISATVKDIRLAGTGAETLNVTLWIG